MKLSNKGVLISLTAMLMLSVISSCASVPTHPVILSESRVQKILKGESANFDGYVLTTGAIARLLEKAEKKCK